jgi:hypothetical protein
MRVLVSDTSVLVDLERGGFLPATFQLPFELVVPDLLYHRELREHDGPMLIKLGLKVEELDDVGVTLAFQYRADHAGLSLPDTFAFVLAKTRGHLLLTGDGELRGLAAMEQIECHGVLWLLDQIVQYSTATFNDLHQGLTAIANHPRCRLPRREISARLQIYEKHR